MPQILCACCGAGTEDFGSAIVLDRHRVNYLRCSQCGAVRTEPPSWLDEAYSNPIAKLDVGLLTRCLYLANVTEAVVRTFPRDSRCLDWAGGYGTLTRLLRDRGLQFWHQDQFSPNLFAADWEGNLGQKWDLITLFEVLEHLVAPFEELSKLSISSPVLLFTTELISDPAPDPGDWWYYALESGQHISFYTRASLIALGERLGMELVTDGIRLHAFHKRGALPRAAKLLIRHPVAARPARAVLRRIRPTPSLLEHDFQMARARRSDR